MSETPAIGRHRAPGRHNPLSEVVGLVGRAGEHGVKAASVVAASGGLVAAFALPAQAATSTSTKATPQAAAFLAAKTTGPSAVKAAPAAVQAAPAVVAPSTIAPVAAETVGITGVSAVEKPAPPPPPPAPVVVAAASVTRAAAAPAAAEAPAAPAPAVNVPASVGGGVLGIAASYSGIYYVYGGSTPAGFDCSGFVQYVFGQAGVSLPRTATAQMHATTRVSDPQPGDLVFFGDGGSAYHVGIYAGNGMMYDSPRTGATSGLHSIWSSQVVYGRV